MMHVKAGLGSTAKLLAGILAGGFLVSGVSAQGAAPEGEAQHAGHTQAVQTVAMLDTRPSIKAPRISANEWRARFGTYYRRNWGLDVVSVKPVSSGYMLSFRYRITDPEKASLLNDRKSKAYLIDEASGTRLAVPAMEKIGELRTGATPNTDRTYFMMFGNPGKLVKSGSQVSIVVGNLKVDGLVVD